MEPRPPADSPPTAELPSELEDITKELAALRGGVDAAIWEQPEEAPPPPPPPKRIENNLASTEHLVNVLAGLSDARDSFAAAWDAEDEEPEAPPPPPPRATKPPRPTPRTRPTNKAAEQRKAAAAASRARREQAAREVEERRCGTRPAGRFQVPRRSVEGQRSSPRRVDERRPRNGEALQEAQLRAECRFKPRTNLGPARVTAADGRRASKRLHQEAQLRRETQMRKRKEAQQLSEEHTLQPQLIASKTDALVEDPSLRRPLHERVAAVERARQLRRDALEKRSGRRSDSSFKPDVNDDQRSTRMARKAAQKMLAEAADAGAQLLEDDSVPPDVAARLAADAWRRSMKRAEDIKKADEARIEAQKRLLSESSCPRVPRIAKKFSSFEEREQMRKKAAEQRKQALEAQRARQRREQFRFTASTCVEIKLRRTHAIDELPWLARWRGDSAPSTK